jgi:hypothetical protein
MLESDLEKILATENSLLSTVCKNIALKKSYSTPVEFDHQLRYIEEQLSLLGITFSEMMQIGSNHLRAIHNDITSDIILNFRAAVRAAVRKILIGKFRDIAIESFIENISLRRNDFESHLSLCYKDTPFRIDKLGKLLNFYKFANLLDKKLSKYEFNGNIVLMPSADIMNKMLLDYIKDKTRELLIEAPSSI